MRNTLKKFIGDKRFYAMVLAVALPIMLQNGITNFVSLLDNIMVGQVGTEQMSGVAIVNQLFFVFNLCIFGAVSGAGIFTAQFFGKNDEEGIRQTLRFKYLAGVVLTAVAVLVLVLLQTPLINLYLHDGSVEGDLELTLKYGKDYLAVMLIGLLPYAVSQVIGSTMRETGHTVMPMLAGLAAVVVNCTGNYILIFGAFQGAPVMGVVGAAIATVASRFVEMLLLIIYTAARKTVFPAFRGVFTRLFSIERELLKNIFKKGMPLFVNEMLWAIGMSGLAMCYSKRGLAVVTGYNIASTVINVFNIAYMALGNAVGIIIGKYLGAGEYDEAVDIDRKLIAFSVFVGTVMGIILLCTAGAVSAHLQHHCRSENRRAPNADGYGLSFPLSELYAHVLFYAALGRENLYYIYIRQRFRLLRKFSAGVCSGRIYNAFHSAHLHNMQLRGNNKGDNRICHAQKAHMDKQNRLA